MKLKILAFPDKRLRVKAKEITDFDEELKSLIENMYETMYKSNGVGLAATQIDRHIRVFVADTSENNDNPLCFVNPIIISKSGEKISEEGCLSVVGFNADVSRAKKVKVEALDENGKKFELEVEDELLAVCIQHEIDHLDGILFVDYLSKLKQKRLLNKIKKDKL